MTLIPKIDNADELIDEMLDNRETLNLILNSVNRLQPLSSAFYTDAVNYRTSLQQQYVTLVKQPGSMTYEQFVRLSNLIIESKNIINTINRTLKENASCNHAKQTCNAESASNKKQPISWKYFQTKRPSGPTRSFIMTYLKGV